MKTQSLVKQYLNTLKSNINSKFKKVLSSSFDNPMLKGSHSWEIVSDQLLDLLGDAVHTKWFKNVQPLVLRNKILILQTESNFAAQWINTHYQVLAEGLLKIQDKDLSCFFIAPKNNI